MATNKDFIVKNGLSVGEDISVSGSVTSNLQFDDSVQLQLGTDSDLLIYHDNSNAYIDDVGAGSLYIRSGTTYFQNAAGTKTSIQTNSGAGQTLYFNNDPIFATLVDGVSVTGNAVLTGELHGPASFVIDPAGVGNNTGAVVIKGDLTVEGTTTTINSTVLTINDKLITLASGSANAAAADGAGIAVDDGSSGTEPTILYTASGDSWNINRPLKYVTSTADAEIYLSSTNTGGDARINLYADSGGVSQIRFGDESDTNVGLITYDHSDNSLSLRAADGNRLIITSAGVDVVGNIVTTANVSAGTYTGSH